MTSGTNLRASVLACAAGLAVAATPALAQSNSCATAVTITTGVYNGTTVGATNDGQGTCGSSGGSPDVWYRYVPAEDGQLTVTTCGSGYDTVLGLWSACPTAAGSELVCNDDSCGLQSAVVLNVTANTPYLIRVSGYAGASGPFTMNVTLGQAPPQGSGPDVMVDALLDVNYYGAANGISAYSVGTNACNPGSAPVTWIANNNQHPVIAQNMYRLKNGRFEHIGMSWLKHGFVSTNSPSICGTCTQPPMGGSQLGVGCSDAYGAGLNGSQSGLGPRYQVNATSGVYTYPPANPGYDSTIGRRLQVNTADVTPANNAGALYFVEGQYVTSDDAGADNALNNASYSRVTIASATATPQLTGGTIRGLPAIHAWRTADPAVTQVNADYEEGAVTARFIVAGKATDNGNGTWHYEYAVFNQNADRAGGTFTVPLPVGASVSNIGFSAPFYHSGEPYSNTPWTGQVVGNSVVFSTQTFAQNQNANALRWSTLYNFRFDSTAAPGTGDAVIGLFKPGAAGAPTSVTAAGVPVPEGAACYANCDGSTNSPVLNVLDFNCFLNAFSAGCP